MLNDTGITLIDIAFQISNTQRRTVRCGEYVLKEKLSQKRSRHAIGFEKKFWKRRFNLTSQQINEIDWSIFKRAQMASTQAKQIW